MRNLFTFICAFLLLSCKAHAQENLKIKLIADSIASTTAKGDNTILIKYMYPKLIAVAGGKDSMLMAVTKIYTKLKSEGILLKDVKMGEPGEVLLVGNKQFSIVPQKIYLERNNKIYYATSSNLAISEDNGQHWYFMALQDDENSEIDEFFPELKGKLSYPKSTHPTLVQ